ncbi:aminoglycoside adenylyltransferase family protein [Chromobacterium vaccinii]|uniref:aminoglycoside adenylyltransferase family protein n=1 Tax=Chromobacterium vaccinii TaxID=1108595 RepID=UPI001C92C3F2|nr:aminoglycoside adenylyltransferase family protein [Chromobacterium vaccinii]
MHLTNIPAEAEQALEAIRHRLGDSLAAVYLHGSAVAGGLRPRSDVDLLAVIERPLTPECRACLVADLLKISGRYPDDADGRRPLEVIVFSKADLASPHYPIPCDWIYGEWLREEYEAGGVSGPVCDPDLVLVLAQARQGAVPLFGPDASSLLPIISRQKIRRAVADALPALIGALRGDERNVLLTLVRMWHTLLSGEFVSKDVAADWAATRLPAGPAAILVYARELYLNRCEEDWESRRHELELTAGELRDQVLASL